MGKEMESPKEQSSYTVEQLVAVNPFNPEILPDLENYVNEQVNRLSIDIRISLDSDFSMIVFRLHRKRIAWMRIYACFVSIRYYSS